MKIFFAAPFTGKINDEGVIEGEYKEWLLSLFVGLREEGYTVISAHEREKWGERLDKPSVAVVNDFHSIKESDILVAYIGSPPSYGVQMELGFAVAFGKPLIILRDKDVVLPYLVPGLGELTVTFNIVMNEPMEDVLDVLLDRLRELQVRMMA